MLVGKFTTNPPQRAGRQLNRLMSAKALGFLKRIRTEICLRCVLRDSCSLKSGDQLLNLLDDVDDLASANVGFLLAPLLHDAQQWGFMSDEQMFMERNAKLRLTIWVIRLMTTQN